MVNRVREINAGLKTGRVNQKQKTRQAILDAAVRLMATRKAPTIEDIAAEAGVSRATAYRYFPKNDYLLAEAALYIGVPGPDEALAGVEGQDTLTRLLQADKIFHDLFTHNESMMRVMLAEGHRLRADNPADATPIRQNRRLPMIEQAIKGGDARLSDEAAQKLAQALSMIIGPEGIVASQDVLGLSGEEALALKRWIIQALLDAAVSQGGD